MRLARIPPGALEVAGAGRLRQCVALVYRPIVGLPAPGAPAAVRDAAGGGEVQRAPIRIHQPEVQKTVLEEVLQIPPEETRLRFGYMLEAFRYGAPPHGGIALGFDRLVAILCGTPSIRDAIALPKTAKGTCLITESPSPVSGRQLRDLHIAVKGAKKE